jgi:hypothetical protein
MSSQTVDITQLSNDKVVAVLKKLRSMRGFKYPVTVIDRENASVQAIVLDNSGELSDFIGVWTNDPHALKDALSTNEHFRVP